MNQQDFVKGLVVGRTQLVFVVGSEMVGQTVVASAPHLVNPSFVWERAGTQIATTAAYTIQNADIGQRLDVFATGTASASINVPNQPPVATAVAPNATWIASAAGAPGAGTTTAWADVNGVPQYGTRAAAVAGGLTVNAMPIVHWWQPSQIRSSGNLLIGVIADAKGGIASVTFGGDIPDTAGTFQYLLDQDVNGNSRIRPFWGVTIDCATAATKHAAGALRLYARATPTDNTITPRTIGPLLIYPRANYTATGSVYDFDVTVDPTSPATGSASAQTGNFQTLNAALVAMHNAIKNSARECGRITITSVAGDAGSGIYDWGDAAETNYPLCYGRCVVTAASGVNVTIVRNSSYQATHGGDGTAFDPTRSPVGTSSSWFVNDPWKMWAPTLHTELLGPGITLDRKNFSTIQIGYYSTNSPYQLDAETGAQIKTGMLVFNGVKVTNSAGGFPQTYWSGTYAPFLTVVDGHGGITAPIVWAISCYSEDQAFSLQGFNCQIFNRHRYCMAPSNTNAGPRFIYGDFVNNCPRDYENYYNGVNGYSPKPSLDLTYNGAGTGSYTLTPNHSAPTALNLLVGGTIVATFSFIDPQSVGVVALSSNGASPPTISNCALWSDIAAWINNPANGLTDWTAAAHPNVFPAIQAVGTPDSGNMTTGTVYTIVGAHGNHTNWYHASSPSENGLIWNCALFNCGWGTQLGRLEGTGYKDYSIKNILYDPMQSSTNGQGFVFDGTCSHIMFENVTMNCPQAVYNVSDTYCTMRQVVSIQMLPVTTYGTMYPTNCVTAGASAPSTAAPYNNVNLNASGAMDAGTWAALFKDWTNRNFTPDSSHALAQNLFAKINDHDVLNVARSATDAAGAVSVNGAAPSWPF